MRSDEDDKRLWEREDALETAKKGLDKAVAERVQAGNLLLIEALRRFATWAPGMFPFKQDADGNKIKKSDALYEAPFVCESYLYALLGKEEARTFLALFNQICASVGVRNYHELQEDWYKAREDAKTAEAERKARVIANAARYKAEGHTFAHEGPCAVCTEKYTLEQRTRGGGNPVRCMHWCLRRVAAGELDTV